MDVSDRSDEINKVPSYVKKEWAVATSFWTGPNYPTPINVEANAKSTSN
jgi:hypothetical protein